MKQNAKITLCALSAALAAVFVLAAYFPYVTYAAPALAGLMMLVPVIEMNLRWAFGCYIASLMPVLLLAEPEAKLLYVFFFGWYPIAKALIERINKHLPEWIIKLVVFNIAVIAAYAVMSVITDVSLEEFGVFGKYGAYIFLALGNIVFVLYDFAIAQVATFYLLRIHPQVKRMFSRK